MTHEVPSSDEKDAPKPVQPHEQNEGRLKAVAGSQNDAFNTRLLHATAKTQRAVHEKDTWDDVTNFVAKGLRGIAPKDEMEGMLGAQLVAAHAAAMDCFMRAALTGQTSVGREMNLNLANKTSRTYATLLEALDRHRGKGGRQTVVVKHVHVHDGGQAIVGTIGTGGSGVERKNQEQPHVQPTAIAHAPGATLWREGTEREPVPSASDAEREVLPPRRREPRSSEG